MHIGSSSSGWNSGYETVIGPVAAGCRVGSGSGSLWRGRCFATRRYLILDEATSQIDIESEQLIHQALEQFVRGTARRLSSLTGWRRSTWPIEWSLCKAGE